MTTKNQIGHFISLTSIDVDWDSDDDISITSIALNPGAALDYVTFRVYSSGDSGPALAYLESSDGEPRIKYIGADRVRVVLDITGSSFASGASIDIQVS